MQIFHKLVSIAFPLLLLPCFAFSQTRISGSVKDSIGNPVSSASVSIIISASGVGIDFSRTMENGTYHFILPDSVDFSGLAVKVNAIGFVKAIKSISKTNTVADFILQAEAKNLPPVTVTNRKALIKVKGDTLSYSVTDFANKNDRVIGDVIRKIPGIEVTENGTIKYQGRPINYFYIDGDNLLDDKYRVATDNIPSDIVDKVQVIENNQHIKALNGIVPVDRAALNITLKNKAKISIINTAKLAAGIPGVYDVEMLNMTFKSRFKAINTLKSNNNGTDLSDEVASLNIADYAALADKQGAETLLETGIGGKPNINKKRFLFNTSGIINFNNLVKTNKDISLRFNGYCLPDKQEQEYSFYTSYYLPSVTITYTEQQNLQSKLHTLHAALTVNVNNSKTYLNNALSVDYKTSADLSDLVANNMPQHQQLNSTISSVSNNLYGVKLFSNQRFFEYFSYISYDNKPQSLFITPGLHKELLNNNTPFYQTIQNANTPGFFTNNYITYRSGIGQLSQNYKLGISYQHTSLESALYITQMDQSVNLISNTFSNHLDWNKYKLYCEANYGWEDDRNKLLLTLPLSNINIRYNDTTLQQRAGTNRLLLTPSLRWQLKVGSENLLSTYYNYNTQLSSMNEIFYGAIMSNYRDFIYNNVPLQQTTNHSFGTTFDFKKSIKLFFVSQSYNYTERQANYLFSYTLKDNISQRVAIALPNSSYTSIATTNVSKYLFPIQTNVFVRYTFQYSRLQQLQNGDLFAVTYYGHSFSAGANVKFSSWASLKYEYLYTWSHSRRESTIIAASAVQKNYYSKHQLDIDIFPSDRFSFRIRNEYYYNSQPLQPSFAFFFGDVFFRYKVNRTPLDLELVCTNISNSDKFSLVNISANTVSGSNYTLRPRALLLRASFNF